MIAKFLLLVSYSSGNVSRIRYAFLQALVSLTGHRGWNFQWGFSVRLDWFNLRQHYLSAACVSYH
jgi:hypothetical protein